MRIASTALRPALLGALLLGQLRLACSRALARSLLYCLLRLSAGRGGGGGGANQTNQSKEARFLQNYVVLGVVLASSTLKGPESCLLPASHVLFCVGSLSLSERTPRGGPVRLSGPRGEAAGGSMIVLTGRKRGGPPQDEHNDRSVKSRLGGVAFACLLIEGTRGGG
jgi:hypothetical protein